MNNHLDIEDLSSFLKEAKKNTYANKDTPQSTSLRKNSKDYRFEKDDLIYHDTYFGGRDFIGEEIVYKNQRPAWGMNYFGFILDDNVDGDELYDFLRGALIQEFEDVIPVRGPGKFSFGDKEYRISVIGDLGNFSGEEKILFFGKIVYRCLVHGGFINK